MSQDSNESAGRDDREGQEPQRGQGGQQTGAQGQEQGQRQGQGTHGRQQQHRGTAEQITNWFTEKLVRVVAVLIGFFLLLFALGQIAGVDLLTPVSDFLTSSIGGYVIIAFVALLIIAAAVKDWDISNT